MYFNTTKSISSSDNPIKINTIMCRILQIFRFKATKN